MSDNKYMSEADRIIEETYACKLIGREIRLTFTEGDYSYTDGHLIVINPLLDNIYLDTQAIRQTETELKLDPFFSGNEQNAVKLVTRLQVIQEALRVKYIDIPTRVLEDEDASNARKRQTLETINQIIDDAYIENAGAALGKIMEQYLKFHRLLLKNHGKLGDLMIHDFRTHTEYEDEQTDKWLKNNLLDTYLEYMSIYTLYPMLHEEMPPRIADYVENTKDYFMAGATTSDPEKRYHFVKMIFSEIEELLRELPEDASGGGAKSDSPHNEGGERTTDTCDPDSGKSEQRENLSRILGHSKTHSEAEMADSTRRNKPEEGNADKPLFGRYEELGDQHNHYYYPNYISEDICNIPEIREESCEKVRPYTLGCSRIHDRITIDVTRPSRGVAKMDVYNSIKSKYKPLINTYRSKIGEYLKTEDDVREGRNIIGNYIDSKHLIDRNRRFWNKNVKGDVIPELSIMFMVDCSYSMNGTRMKAVKEAMVIMNEVLYGQNIEYAVFGHTAILHRPNVVHNLCLDFGASSLDKYNLMTLNAVDGSREGVSLLWADEYLRQNSHNKDKILIAISDGEPIHISMNESCCPPESVIDAAKCVKTIMHHGTKVIAIALEGNGEPCYDKLTKIYPSVIECGSMSKLPKQILELIEREIKSHRTVQ